MGVNFCMPQFGHKPYYRHARMNLMMHHRFPEEMKMRTLTILLLICTTLLPFPTWADDYQSVSIASPQPETTIHNNNGNLDVTVAVSPPLRTANGDVLTILLDDKAVASGTRLHYKLKGIDRGTHTLAAQITAADGKVLITSEPVTFYMWRASRLFRNR